MKSKKLAKIKPGTTIDTEELGVIVFVCCSERDNEIVYLTASHRGTTTVVEHTYDAFLDPVDEWTTVTDKKRVRVASFERSDGYYFVIWREDKVWNLHAGCHHYSDASLQELHEHAKGVWCNDHKTAELYDSDKDDRVALNKESRRGIKRLIKKFEKGDA